MTLFSVIIPTFDRPRFLAEAIASLQAQTYSDFECIVVDDNSAVPAVIPDDPRFRLVRLRENRGPASAVNAGLRESLGRFIVRMDDDDLFTPDRLELAHQGTTTTPIALCWARYIDEAPSAKRWLDGDVGDEILDATTPHMGAAAVHRDLFLPLDESYLGAEDVEWWLRVAQIAPMSTVPQFGYLIRRHQGPRVLHGVEARLAGSRRLLEEYSQYFEAHPKATAFRLKRIGLMEFELCHRNRARVALARALRLHPELRTVKHLLRTLAPPLVRVSN